MLGAPELLLLMFLFNCSPAAQSCLCVSSIAGVRFIEEDALRYHTASRVPLDMLLAAASTTGPARTLQQVQPFQPYGLAAVQATTFLRNPHRQVPDLHHR